MKLLVGIFVIAAVLQPNVLADLAESDVDNKVSGPEIILPAPSTSCNCPAIYRPACGTDGKTYSNACVLKCISWERVRRGLSPIYVKSQGRCSLVPWPCPLVYRPVCASNGETFNNWCLLNSENRRRLALGLKPLTLQYYGACCRCSGTWDPVCASDGKTYRNRCILRCLNKTRIQNGLPPLTIQCPGVCGCNCKKYYDPVCGTDGKTYANICLLQCEIKRRLYLGLPSITLKHFGLCVCNCSYCSVAYSPVCGNNGKTYWNYSWLKCYSNCNVNNNLPKITVVKFGSC